MPTQEVEHSYLENGGIRVPYFAWSIKNPQAVIVLIHGLKSHSGWFLDAGRDLAERGIKVYAFDRRGSGRSEAERGDIQDYRLWLDDLDAMAALAAREHPDEKPHLLGHCFGAKLAVAYALRHSEKVQSLILVAPPQFSLKADLPPWQKGKVLLAALLRKKWSIPVPIRDEMFTRNPEKLRFIREDPLRLQVMTTRLCWEVFRLDRWMNRRLRHLELPVLVLLSHNDLVVDNARIVSKFLPRLGGRLKEVEGFDCGHQLFFDPGSDQVIARVEGWVKRIPGL
jgi:alpha-beta hydrolase superfamily lysophospholipase